MCNLNVIVVQEFISRDLYLLFAIRFSSKFQNSVFYQRMRPKSGLKFPRPFAYTSTLTRPSLGLLPIVFLQNFDRVMALDLRQKFVSAQYLQNKFTECHQILYAH